MHLIGVSTTYSIRERFAATNLELHYASVMNSKVYFAIQLWISQIVSNRTPFICISDFLSIENSYVENRKYKQ